MEPVFMVLSESAAIAAGLAIDSDKAVQEIEWEKLEKRLRDNGQRF